MANDYGTKWDIENFIASYKGRWLLWGKGNVDQSTIGLGTTGLCYYNHSLQKYKE